MHRGGLQLCLLEEQNNKVNVGIKVCVHHLLHVGHRKLVDPLAHRDRRIVDQDVNGAMLREDLRPDLLDARIITDVALVEKQVCELLASFLIQGLL